MRRFLKRMILPVLILTAISMLCSCSGDKNPAAGKYVTSDGLAWVTLGDDGDFVFLRNTAASYTPAGTYAVNGDSLILKAGDEDEYIFSIDGGRLIFESGVHAESLIEKGTVFELSDE